MSNVPRVVTFCVTGIPQPKGSTKAFLPRGWTRPIVTSDNPRAKGWQQLVAEQAQTVAREGFFTGPVAVALIFRLPRPASAPKRVVHHVTKPDLDKLARCAIDGLIGVLLPDDRVVVELRARKLFAPVAAAPGAEITVADAAPPLLAQPSCDLLAEA